MLISWLSATGLILKSGENVKEENIKKKGKCSFLRVLSGFDCLFFLHPGHHEVISSAISFWHYRTRGPQAQTVSYNKSLLVLYLLFF